MTSVSLSCGTSDVLNSPSGTTALPPTFSAASGLAWVRSDGRKVNGQLTGFEPAVHRYKIKVKYSLYLDFFMAICHCSCLCCALAGKGDSKDDVQWQDSSAEEARLWRAMLDRANAWIEGVLLLRPHMDRRK